MEYIDTENALADAAQRLRTADLLAVDTEAAGYHRYRDRICLLQVSSRQDTFIVDTLALNDLQPLSELLQRDHTEAVFHDADYDLRLLSRDFDLHIRHLFDTKIAAQFLGEPAIGLGALAQKYLSVNLEKKHQRADWAQRPLPPELIEYAAEDTRHLPALRDHLHQALVERGRLHWAEEEFALARETRWRLELEPVAGFLKVKGARDLTARQLAALRELVRWREAAAEARDAAAFRVLSNEAMLEIARTMPTKTQQLDQIKGISASLRERRAHELTEAVQRALDLPESELPSFPRGPRRPAPDPAFEERMEKLRKARDDAADALGLDRGFLMPRTQLEAVARLQPKSIEALKDVPEIRRWQIEVLGGKLLLGRKTD
jgi:ribonuclease D